MISTISLRLNSRSLLLLSCAEIDVSGRCVMWGTPTELSTFDRESIGFQGWGEYLLFRDVNASEQASIISIRDPLGVSAITGLSFLVNGTVVEVRLNSTMNGVTMRVNHSEVPLEANTYGNTSVQVDGVSRA